MSSNFLAYFQHDLNPVLLPIYGDFAIRWYGIAYILGFITACGLLKLYFKTKRSTWNSEAQINAILYLALGTMIGGRLGFMLLYDLHVFLRNPLSFFEFWKGGMASHGGFVGCLIAAFLIARRTKTPFLKTTDLIVTVAPPGLLFGRIANFINGELWGKLSNVPWAVIFPTSTPPNTPLELVAPRHPSQLYEAALEALVLGAYIQLRFWRSNPQRMPAGQLSGEFLVAYSILRIIGEVFREPDPAGLILGLSRGVFYSIILGTLGIFWIVWVRKTNLFPATRE